MSARLRKSEAQANAEALARRSSTYAGDHARTWELAVDFRKAEPTTLDGYVREVRRAMDLEAPDRTTTRDVAGDGSPQLSDAFISWIGLDSEDGMPVQGTLRYALAGMTRGNERMRRMARIAWRIAVGVDPTTALVTDEQPGNPLDSISVSTDALRAAWRGMRPKPPIQTS